MSSPALTDLIDLRRDELRAVVRACKGTEAWVIGSVARGDEHAGSDLDLVVRFASGASSLHHVRLVRRLEELLGVEVDVISAGALPAGSPFWQEARSL